MPRFFTSLAIATLTLFVLTATIAMLDSGSEPDRHILLAVGTLLMSCFIQVVGFTYLTVTGKVIAQAAHLANLDSAFLNCAKRYKRTFTRLLALVVLSIVLASATGGAAWRSRTALAFHIPAALIAALAHVWVYREQYRALRRNADLVKTTLEAYSAWRDRRITGTSHGAAIAECAAQSP